MTLLGAEKDEYLLVRRTDHWADEHDCPALALITAESWHAQVSRARRGLPAEGVLSAAPGEDVEVSWSGGVQGWLDGFQACSLPAREGAELARALCTGARVVGPMCMPDGVRSWFLADCLQSPSSPLPEPPHAQDPWCLLVFRGRSHGGLPMGWLGLLPLRSWDAIKAHVTAQHGGRKEIEASYGSNEHVLYDSVNDWLGGFAEIPCSDALARFLVGALGRHDCAWSADGQALIDVLLPQWGLLPVPLRMHDAFRTHAARCDAGVCYMHGNAVGACTECTGRMLQHAPCELDPALARLGPDACASRFVLPARVAGLGDVDVTAFDRTTGIATAHVRGSGKLVHVLHQDVERRPDLGLGLSTLGPLVPLPVLLSLPSRPLWSWIPAAPAESEP